MSTPSIPGRCRKGGIDEGEDTYAAALRELYEETSIRSVEKLGEVRGWLRYDIPREIVGQAWKGKYRGQKQKWYALRFTGKDSEIDIEHPSWRPQPGISGLALGADGEAAGADHSVQAAGLRAGGEGIFQVRGQVVLAAGDGCS